MEYSFRPILPGQCKPVVGPQVTEYSGEKGHWSVAEAALLSRGAFGGEEFGQWAGSRVWQTGRAGYLHTSDFARDTGGNCAI
jgi:hypothetical protein